VLRFFINKVKTGSERARSASGTRKLDELAERHIQSAPPPLWRPVTDCDGTLCAHSKSAKRANLGFSLSIKRKQDQSMLAVQAEHANSTNLPSSTQKELKIHGQKGHLQRSRAVEKKNPSNLSELPQNFTSIQTHYKPTFLKD